MLLSTILSAFRRLNLNRCRGFSKVFHGRLSTLLGGTDLFLKRDSFFHRDPNVDNHIAAVRKLRIEVVAILLCF